MARVEEYSTQVRFWNFWSFINVGLESWKMETSYNYESSKTEQLATMCDLLRINISGGNVLIELFTQP